MENGQRKIKKLTWHNPSKPLAGRLPQEPQAGRLPQDKTHACTHNVALTEQTTYLFPTQFFSNSDFTLSSVLWVG